jgi:non-ribosomal peptide synthetase component F
MAARIVEACGDPPAVVGVLATRSLTAYCGYLGALRLGAAVVPLHAGTPIKGNAWTCDRAGVDVVVADPARAGYAADLAATTGASAVIAYADGSGALRELATHPWREPCHATADDVAYVLFTSGSTGQAKGIPVRHRQLGDYLTYCLDRYQLDPDARLAQGYSLTFDPSVLVMFLSWGSGATLVIPQADELLNPALLVATQRITHWWSVPSMISLAHQFGALPPGSMPGLVGSGFIGEQLTTAQARAWAAAAPASTIENGYGPTELTVTCAAYRLPGDPADWPATPNATVPIGRIFPHLQALLLAQDGAVAPLRWPGAKVRQGAAATRDHRRGPALPTGS